MDADLVKIELVTEPQDVQEVIDSRIEIGPMVVCDHCMDTHPFSIRKCTKPLFEAFLETQPERSTDWK
jgi:hypothetical protein